MNTYKLRHTYQLEQKDWQDLKTIIIKAVTDSPDAFSTMSKMPPDGPIKRLPEKQIVLMLNDKSGVVFGTSGEIAEINFIWVDVKEKGYGGKLLSDFVNLVKRLPPGSSCVKGRMHETNPVLCDLKLKGWKTGKKIGGEYVEIKYVIK